jgi:hypothetical protein
VSIAARSQRTHTLPMSVPVRSHLCLAVFLLAGAGLCGGALCADEIRLKDGKKLHGVIVAYEDNMFKVKTDFGYVLVEKDKIASIIPDTPAESAAEKTKPPAKTKGTAEANRTKSAPEPPAAAQNSSSPLEAQPSVLTKKDKVAEVTTNAHARPEIPKPPKTTADANMPALKTSAAAPKTTLTNSSAPLPPKEEPPPIREEVQGNLYINHEFGFRMYKAPSWQIIEGAGQTLPNAIVAMGTANESTLLVVGREKSKASLESAADGIEKRLQEVYENYRLLSQRKTVLGGQPAIEYRYRGLADGHDWSGALSVVSHGGEVLTVLGMTFADSDLIQIQENVIARSIASLDFNIK